MDHAEEYSTRAIVRPDGYACPNQLITVIEAMEYDFALWLVNNMKYSRWEVNIRKRYWSKLAMPMELKDWFIDIEDACLDSI